VAAKTPVLVPTIRRAAERITCSTEFEYSVRMTKNRKMSFDFVGSFVAALESCAGLGDETTFYSGGARFYTRGLNLKLTQNLTPSLSGSNRE
jgi:hypothetical protein